MNNDKRRRLQMHAGRVRKDRGAIKSISESSTSDIKFDRDDDDDLLDRSVTKLTFNT